MQPPENDPTRSMWQMTPVPDVRVPGRRRSGLRVVAGTVGGLATFSPFVLVAGSIWGWWQGESSWSGGGWAVVVIGLSVGGLVGGFVASDN